VSNRTERAATATVALRDAVLGLKMGERPVNNAIPIEMWHTLGRDCIANWVDDAGRCCERIAEALALTDVRDRDKQTLDGIETALWRIDAAREKLEAVFVLAFGVPSLERYGKSARFEPDTDSIKAKVSELAAHHPVARELGKVAQQLAAHPAVTLRNQLSHQLAPIESANESCWIDVAHLQGRSIVGWSGGPFYGEGVLEEGDIGSNALWQRALRSVEECFGLLIRLTKHLAELIHTAAVLEPPQRLYKQEETGEVSVTDPRFRES
jgi:hypothetical protein